MNNINFFITLKLQLSDQINTHDKLRENYSNIDIATLTNNDEIQILENYLKILNSNPTQIENLKILLDMTNKHIQNICQHEMEDDYIDINPETTMYISYCKICGLNN